MENISFFWKFNIKLLNLFQFFEGHKCCSFFAFLIINFKLRMVFRIGEDILRARLLLGFAAVKIDVSFCNDAVLQKLFGNLIVLHFRFEIIGIKKILCQRFCNYSVIREIRTTCTFLVQNKKYNQQSGNKSDEVEFEFFHF